MTHDTDGDDVETLRARLAEANEALLAIRQGDVDALIVQVGDSDQIYTRHTADEPYRDLVEQMQEGAVVLAASGDILYCNARFADLVGAPLKSVIGARIDRFVHASDWGAVQALLEARNGRCRGRLIGSGAAAIEVYLSLTTTASKDTDRLNLVVTDLREILEAHNVRDRAERDSRTKDEFLAMLAHELRNPIGAINTAVQVLEQAPGDGEPATRARGVIARQTRHLAHLVDDLLDVGRVVSGKVRLNRRPIDLSESVRLAVESLASATAPGCRIDVNAEPVWVDGDVARLDQVLSNLLTNAISHTSAGCRILVTLRGDGDEAMLTVDDTGIGISPELLPFIFDVFVQGDRTLDRTQGGLGIGLTLVRHLVELHGGTVVASSAGTGHGSRFTVRLPRIPAVETSPAIARPLDPVRPARVLVIEDNDDAREMLRLMLEFSGHVVYDAADGVRGLELLGAEHPDVAIIDIGLPGLDGYQVARRMRERLHGRPMLLVALTGYGRPDDHQRSAEAGFDHHLVKPLDPDELTRLFSAGARSTSAA